MGAELTSAGVLRYLAGPDVAGQRLDQAAASLTGLSRRHLRQLIASGAVWVNGKACRVASKPLKLGDVLDLLPPAQPLHPPQPLPPNLPILFEDGHLLACAKPAGMLTQPSKERLPGELSAWEVLTLCLSYREGHRLQLFVVHRLDRVASGLLLFAKNHDAAAFCSQAFASQKVEKTYLAVVAGSPAEAGSIVAPVAADPLVPGRFRVAPKGKKAVTKYQTLAKGKGLALLCLAPLTGRTHQIRVHLQSIGCPIVGDSLYGSTWPAPRPLLHAWRLRLPHPKDGHPVHLEAPIPADLLGFCLAQGLALPATLATGLPPSADGS